MHNTNQHCETRKPLYSDVCRDTVPLWGCLLASSVTFVAIKSWSICCCRSDWASLTSPRISVCSSLALVSTCLTEHVNPTRPVRVKPLLSSPAARSTSPSHSGRACHDQRQEHIDSITYIDIVTHTEPNTNNNVPRASWNART